MFSLNFRIFSLLF